MARRKKKTEEEVSGDARMKVELQPPGPMRPELKYTIRKMIRDAIIWQNKQTLFTCRQCCFYRPAVLGGNLEGCTLEPTNKLVLQKRMPHQLPECFLHDPLDSAFAGVLNLMHSLGIDFHDADHGWATVVGRLAKRMNRFGYITGINLKNLERY